MELGLEDVTLRGFINGKPKTLGEPALRVLLAKSRDLEKLYKRHRIIEAPADQPVEPADLAGEDEALGVQLALNFDGFDFQVPPITIKLEPGSEGTVTIRLKAS